MLRPQHLYRTAVSRLTRVVEGADAAQALWAIDKLCRLPGSLGASLYSPSAEGADNAVLEHASFTTMLAACRRMRPPNLTKALELLDTMRSVALQFETTLVNRGLFIDPFHIIQKHGTRAQRYHILGCNSRGCGSRYRQSFDFNVK